MYDEFGFEMYPLSAFRPGPGGSMRLFKKDGPAPDPAIGAAALRQIDLAERQWNEYVKEGGDRDWLKGITDEAMDIQREQAQKSGELTDYQLGMMKFSDDRYRTNTIPYQDRLDAEIERLYSPTAIEGRVGAVAADTAAGMDNTMAQMRRGLDRRGVNPNSGNAMALENANSVAKATAVTSAANKTRQAMEQVGLATKFQSLGAKLGIAGLGSTNAGLATSAMGTGLNAAGGMGGSAAGMIGTNNATFNASMGGMTAGISGANANASNAIRANESGGDFWGGAGSIMGGLANMKTAGLISDIRYKKNIKLVARDPRGFGWYDFEYVFGGPRQRGVMAQEVMRVIPAAVTEVGGVLTVDYTKL